MGVLTDSSPGFHMHHPWLVSGLWLLFAVPLPFPSSLAICIPVHLCGTWRLGWEDFLLHLVSGLRSVSGSWPPACSTPPCTPSNLLCCL